MPTDIDQFKLNNLRVKSIDNEEKRLYYEGSFFGNHETYDQVDWGIYSVIEVTGMPLEEDAFYKDLIAQAYTLYNEGKNKLSYFLVYSAFESFINLNLDKFNDDRRLIEKLKELY